MNITPPADDLSVQSLKQQSREPASVQQTQAITPKPAIDAYRQQQRPGDKQRRVTRYKGEDRRSVRRDRRQSERRGGNSEVMLDTRAKRDRRQSCRREDGSAAGGREYRRGISVRV